MEAESKRQRWTYADFARLPTSGSTRHEGVDGELVVRPHPACVIRGSSAGSCTRSRTS